MSKRDLFVVVADLDAENAVRTLLVQRQRALGIRLDFNPNPPPQGDLLRYSGRDPGCYKKAVDLLGPPQRTHSRAMLIFDRHGCGAEAVKRVAIESEVEESLCVSGWDDDCVSVIVIEPELEAWVWASSPQVADALGWQDDRKGLRPFLTDMDLWDPGSPKPHDPKRAVARAAREKNRPLNARLFSDLASRVGVSRCQDPAFRKLAETLQRWYPE